MNMEQYSVTLYEEHVEYLVTSFYNERKKNNIHFATKLFVCFSGGLGQLGSECARKLRNVYGKESVILTDIVRPSDEIIENGPYIFADILDFKVKDC